jgi:hypothetical protein
MKVKVGSKIYDGNDQPVMVILSKKDKFNIAHMPPRVRCYCSFPDGMDAKKVLQWMKR